MEKVKTLEKMPRATTEKAFQIRLSMENKVEWEVREAIAGVPEDLTRRSTDAFQQELKKIWAEKRKNAVERLERVVDELIAEERRGIIEEKECVVSWHVDKHQASSTTDREQSREGIRNKMREGLLTTFAGLQRFFHSLVNK